jgi:translation initiation factor 2B subunit (eIF-2B alpha/beta/delta family)
VINGQESRWREWIGIQEYRERLQAIECYITELPKHINTSGYTPHDVNHCLAVESMVKALIRKSTVKLDDLEKDIVKLTDLEKFILFGAVWLHDLGMFETISRGFFKSQGNQGKSYSLQDARDRHDEISAWYLSSNYRKILGIKSDKGKSREIIDNKLRNYVYTINVISRFHRMRENISDCPKERFLKGEKIRTRLLACFLRLGDTLHVDSSRFDERLYEVLQIGQLDRGARLHWLKSYVVSNIYLDPRSETVFVNIDLPMSFKSPQGNEVDREGVKNLVSAIIHDLFDDALIVREVFKSYGLSAYERVKPNICFVPGYSQKYSDELEGVMNDLGVVFFPNTSKVIEKAFGSVVSICNMKFEERADYLENQMKELLKYLKDVHKKRPCHVGLGKIIAATEEAFDSFQSNIKDAKNVTAKQVKDCQREIRNKINKLKEKREDHLKKLYRKCKSNLLDGFKNIILFAYSETVTTFLNKYGEHHPSWKDKIKLYVLEGSGKKRFANNNKIEFSDGLYYVFQLSKHNFKNISLLPDTSFGSLASHLKEEKKKGKGKSLVLFGVNGICKKDNYSCGHTSGHLMVAIVAKRHKIPVKVIADSFKIGEIDWNPTLTRDTPWLTGERDLLDEIKRRGITLKNYVEDRIPMELIDEIVKDGDNIERSSMKRKNKKITLQQ